MTSNHGSILNMSLSPPKLGSVQMPAQTEQDVIAEEKDEDSEKLMKKDRPDKENN